MDFYGRHIYQNVLSTSDKGSNLYGNNLLPEEEVYSFPFLVDPFSEGTWPCTANESQNFLPWRKRQTYLPRVFNLFKNGCETFSNYFLTELNIQYD